MKDGDMQHKEELVDIHFSEITNNILISSQEKSGASSNKRGEDFYFAGFKSPNYTPIPDEFFDLLAPRLSEAELRVLLYIMRRTFGFKKQADAISLSQLTGGIRKRNGEVMDTGTGLSKPAALKGVAGLQDKGIIIVEKRVGEDGRNEINVYRLRYAEGQTTVEPSPKSNGSKPGYSASEQTYLPSPDLRPIATPSALAIAPQVRGTIEEGGRERVGEMQREVNLVNQAPVGKQDKSGVNLVNQAPVDKQDKSGVNQIYSGSKANLPPTQAFMASNSKPNLPMPMQTSSSGKADLPLGVKSVNRGGNSTQPRGVNQINIQHGSIQENSNQERYNNKPEHSQQHGNLAIKPQEVVVDITNVKLLEQDQNALELVVEEELMAYGLSRKVASGLVANWSPDYIRQKIKLVEELRRRNPQAVRNLPGFIRQAINEDYQPAQKPATANRPVAPASRYRRVNGSGADFSGKTDYLSRSEFARNSDLTTTSKELETTVSEEAQRPATPEKKSYTSAQCEVLWERVCDALEGRYRRSDLATKVTKAHLEIMADLSRATIRLSQPWLINSLLLADRALLQMAFSQEVGPGYCLEIIVG
ncbi:MAG: hypothetical protein WCS37_06960 [Chloroflexota bacterium]